jgi:prepilin-type processing-associated H-X9-DG protein
LQNTQISYFVGVDAQETYPTMFLSGDDYLATNRVAVKSGLLTITTNVWVDCVPNARGGRHEPGGNIVLADGSVHPMGRYRLRKALEQTGQSSNRLAIP